MEREWGKEFQLSETRALTLSLIRDWHALGCGVKARVFCGVWAVDVQLLFWSFSAMVYPHWAVCDWPEDVEGTDPQPARFNDAD